MGYATVIDVVKQNTARKTFTPNTKPTASQVIEYLDETAGELDSILGGQDYALPVPTTATGALRTLEYFNALGGAAMVEQAAPTSDRRDSALALWENAKKMLIDGVIEFTDVPRSSELALPRAAEAASPWFSRDMDL
jgi:hypothetical protein